MMILFFLLLIGVIAYAAGWRPQLGQWTQPGRPNQPGNPASSGTNHALEILRERYARGEISRDEFDRMREVLQD